MNRFNFLFGLSDFVPLELRFFSPRVLEFHYQTPGISNTIPRAISHQDLY